MVYIKNNIKIRLKISKVVFQENSQNLPNCGFAADNKTLILSSHCCQTSPGRPWCEVEGLDPLKKGPIVHFNYAAYYTATHQDIHYLTKNVDLK